jgi:glutamate N-acetyltransferase/amino-acid N-acetyltransferase
MSTGPIGSYLDVASVAARIPELVGQASREGGENAAEAILTTDSRAKTVIVNGPNFVLGGIAKGAAMLRPDMATMLAVLTTDAAVEPAMLKPVLVEAAAMTLTP